MRQSRQGSGVGLLAAALAAAAGLAACTVPPPPVPALPAAPAPAAVASPPVPAAPAASEPTPVGPGSSPNSPAPAPPVPDPVADLITALAQQATATVAAALSADVTVALAGGETCTGRTTCAAALTEVLAGATVHLVRRLVSAPGTEVLQGFVVVEGRRVPFAAIVRLLPSAEVAELRVYGNSLAWRYWLPPPPDPAPPPQQRPERIDTAPTFAPAPFVAAFEPVRLAADATAGGLVAAGLQYHDTASGRETATAGGNRLEMTAFLQAFRLVSTHLVAEHAAGTWLVLERELQLEQRLPLVPLPPVREVLALRTLEILLIQNGQIVQVWGYSDPQLFWPVVAVAPILPLH